MFAEQSDDAVWKESFLEFSKNIPKFEKRLEVFTHIDICPLDTVKDIVAGKVPVASPYMPSANHPCYTPETYILHLNNIIRLMDTYKGYYFIPVSPESYPNYNLLVNDGGSALLSHSQINMPMLMEFHRPEIVLACKEHLMQIIDNEGGVTGSKKRVKAELNRLISELRKGSGAATQADNS